MGRSSGRTWGGGWILWGMVACTPVEPPASDASPPADGDECTAADALPVVTTIQTRDHEVTVHAADQGLRFTVSLAGGVLLAHQLTEGEFEQSFPGLHHRYRSAFAGDQTWLDASAQTPRSPPRDTVHLGL